MNKEEELLTIVYKPQKLIFCDIDGTLVGDDKEVCKDTINALQNLINNNPDYHFVLTSGRNLADELYLYKKLGLKSTGLLIGNNGAQIYSLKNHKILHETLIPSDVAKKMYEELMEIAKVNKKMFFMVTYKNSASFLYNFPNHLWEDYHFYNSPIKKEFDANDIVNISVMFLDDYREKFVSDYSNLGLNIIDGPILTAIGGNKVSKEDAIKWVCEHYNIAFNNVAVFGDSRNDIGMFSLPNVFSVTCKDAKSYLKKLAKLVVEQPKSVFIATAIKEFKNKIDKQEQK